jgi:hypothetical protein
MNKPLTEKEQLKERLSLIKNFSSKPEYPKVLNAVIHTGSLSPRKKYWSKLLGSIKTQISTNLFNLL